MLKLSSKLVLLFLVVTLLPLLFVSIYMFFYGRATILQDTNRRLGAVNVLKEAEFERWVKEHRDSLENLAQRPLVVENTRILKSTTLEPATAQATRQDLLQRHFAPYLDDNGGYRVLFILDAQTGQVLAASDPTLVGQHRQATAYFQQGLLGTNVQAAAFSPDDGAAIMPVSTPIFAEDAVLAVLGGFLDVREMSEIMGRPSSSSPTEETYLVNAAGLMLTDSRFEEGLAFQRLISTTGVENCLAAGQGSGEYLDYRGQEVLGVYNWIPDFEVCILTEIDRMEAFAPISEMRKTFVLFSGSLAMVVVLAGLLISGSLTRPLQRLAEGARQIGQGNLTYRIGMKSRDEVGRVATAFDQMAENLQFALGESLQNRRLMEALGRPALDIQRAETRQEIFQQVGDDIARLGYTAVIYTLLPDGRSLKIPYLSLKPGLQSTAERLTGLTLDSYQVEIQPGGLISEMLAAGEPRLFDPIAPLFAELLPPAIRPLGTKLARLTGLEQGFIAPLMVAGSPYGLLVMSGKGLTEKDLPGIRAFATQISMSLENIRLLEDLRSREAYFRSLIENASDVIFVVTEEGFFTYCSPSMERMGGYSPQSLIGKRSFGYVHPEDRQQVMAAHQAIVEQPGQTQRFEFRFQALDGSWRDLEGVGQTARLPDGSQLVVINARDIGERKLAEAALRKAHDELEQRVQERTQELETSERRYRTLAEAAPDMIYVIDPDFVLRYTNSHAAGMYSRQPQDIVGQPLEVFFPDQVIENQKASLRQVFESGEPLSNESQVVVGGRELWLSNTLVPLPDEGGAVSAVMGVSRDITARRKMENSLRESEEQLQRYTRELERSNDELQQFAYVASHDLQEPLRMVASYLQLLERRYGGLLDDEGHEFIGYAVDGATRMKTLINDLLAYSRVGTHGKEFAPVALEEVLEHVSRDLRLALEESGGQITHDPLPEVLGDAGQMEQLFRNLIGNGIKFRSEQPPRIHVGVDEAAEAWTISVCDNGIGFEQQYAERIFVIFQRLHTREEYPGTGIGLAISQRIVNRHGGDIWVTSQPGTGTTFYFSIPKNGVG